MRQDLKALKSFTYAGRALQAGDPFHASRRDARVLRAVGRAAFADSYKTAEVVAEVAKAPPKKAEAKPAVKKAKALAK
jgi:hypothetical protein